MHPDRPVKKARKRAPPTTIDEPDKGVRPRRDAPLPRTRPPTIYSVVHRWVDAPEPALRLEIIRIFAPLAVLGFMSSRLRHADEWLTDAGFQPPEIPGGDWRQPFYLSPVSSTTAWAIAALMVISGLAVAAGFRARIAALVFASTLAYVGLADRLAAFTVTKLSPAVMLALAASPCGVRFGVDAWLRRRRDRAARLPEHVAAAGPRFFQVLIPVFYCGSAIAKAKGGWLKHPFVLWTHLHDSYQTAFSWALANALPAWTWTLLQAMVFALEAGAPIWCAWPRMRPWGLLLAVGMHAMIGLMFWPVRWFSLLMITLWCGAYLPAAWLTRAAARTERM
jgi:uncharacterized membrane protein YphA (DoxX/SURF4 family)